MRQEDRKFCFGRRRSGIFGKLLRRLAIAGAVVSTTPLVTIIAQAEEKPVAGHIQATSHGLSPGYYIRREQDGGLTTVDLGNYTTIYSGDRIVVDDVGHWVQFSPIDGAPIQIRRAESPFDVAGTVALRTPLSNLIAEHFANLDAWIRNLGKRDLAEAIDEISATTRGKPGGDLRSPLLNVSDLRLIAGERHFALDWNGGKKLFEVSIYRGAEVDPLGEWSGIDRRELEGEIINFASGNHTIVVRDETGSSLEANVIVVAPDVMPEPSAEALAGISDPLAQRLASALWLATQDDSWTLEAFLQASQLTSTYPPAYLLAEKLAEGQRFLP